LKKIVAIIACLAILLQTFNQVVIVASWYANKDFIAKNLCENKNKPKLHCDGKCCLKKKLAKESKEQAPSPQNQKNESVNLFYADLKFEIRHITFNIPTEKHFSYNELLTASFHHSVFHPPTV
jgi:hypothetical protein